MHTCILCPLLNRPSVKYIRRNKCLNSSLYLSGSFLVLYQNLVFLGQDRLSFLELKKVNTLTVNQLIISQKTKKSSEFYVNFQLFSLFAKKKAVGAFDRRQTLPRHKLFDFIFQVRPRKRPTVSPILHPRKRICPHPQQERSSKCKSAPDSSPLPYRDQL